MDFYADIRVWIPSGACSCSDCTMRTNSIKELAHVTRFFCARMFPHISAICRVLHIASCLLQSRQLTVASHGGFIRETEQDQVWSFGGQSLFLKWLHGGVTQFKQGSHRHISKIYNSMCLSCTSVSCCLLIPFPFGSCSGFKFLIAFVAHLAPKKDLNPHQVPFLKKLPFPFCVSYIL